MDILKVITLLKRTNLSGNEWRNWCKILVKAYFVWAKVIKSHQGRRNLLEKWLGNGGEVWGGGAIYMLKDAHEWRREDIDKRDQKSLPIYSWTCVSSKEVTKYKPSLGSLLKELISHVYNQTLLFF